MDRGSVARHIALWLSEYSVNAGTHGFVIGVSGGIDSAVCSTLAAMTGCRTLCVTLPIHQSASHTDRAAEHIEFLKGRYDNVDSADANLTDAFDVFARAMPEYRDDHKRELALANTRSRLRMTALYYLAGIENLLVVGTGNKVEDFGVGFFTKYGDGGVDISPIGDLTKTEVYELGRYLGVPVSVIDAQPSDGLFGDDRTDEQQIGASYPELEWAMEQYEKGADAAGFSGRRREVYDIFVRRHRANRHKMVLPPVCKIPDELR